MRSALILLLTLHVVYTIYQVEVFKKETLRQRLFKEGKLKHFLDVVRKMRLLKGLSQTVADYDDFAYLANITIGSNKQSFMVVLDTGSSNVWIPDSTCGVDPDSHSKESCESKTKFNSSLSTTYETDGNAFHIEYGTGSAAGYLGKDELCFCGTKLCIANQTFGQATYLAPFFAQQNIDGVLGLAFKEISTSSIEPPFINAVQQKLVPEPIFTVYLEHHQGVSKKGGVFTYGGLDTDNCGPVIAWEPLSQVGYWQIEIKGVEVGSLKLERSWQAMSDTGTSFIGLPSHVFTRIAKEYSAEYVPEFDMYTIDCDKAKDIPSMDIFIGDKTYQINGINLVSHTEKDECELAFFSMDSLGFGPQWILGDPFIRQFCNIHDVDKK